MKPPKRTYTTNFLEWGDEFCHRLSSGQQRAYARWKRKNRIKQLKHTIGNLTDENAKLKAMLGTRISDIVNAELGEEARAALAFAQQHMRLCHMKDPAPEVMHDEDGKICLRVHRNPVVITWDNKPIGPVADWYKNLQH